MPDRPNTQKTTEIHPCTIDIAGFAGDFISLRRFADRDHTNIVQWNTYDTGGHYCAHQVPDVPLADIREFFHGLR